MEQFIKELSAIGIEDVGVVGVKNAFLGEAFNKLSHTGLCIPNGFSVTVAAYEYYIRYNGLQEPLETMLSSLDIIDFSNLKEVAAGARRIIMIARFPRDLEISITNAYKILSHQNEREVAVRASTVSKGLTYATDAGYESYLNIKGEIALIYAVKRCFASMYSEKAIKSRKANNCDHKSIYLSIGVQQMVRSDLGCSGRGITTIDHSGLSNVAYLNGTWGLGSTRGSNIEVNDEFRVVKPICFGEKGKIMQKKLGNKNTMLIYSDTPTGTDSTFSKMTPRELREKFVLEDTEIEKLAYWSMLLEHQYKGVIDFEWAKDGNSQELYITQIKLFQS